MIEPPICPNCEGTNTERVFTDFQTGRIEATHVCNDCPAQYTITYHAEEKDLDFVGEP